MLIGVANSIFHFFNMFKVELMFLLFLLYLNIIMLKSLLVWLNPLISAITGTNRKKYVCVG